MPEFVLEIDRATIGQLHAERTYGAVVGCCIAHDLDRAQVRVPHLDLEGRDGDRHSILVGWIEERMGVLPVQRDRVTRGEGIVRTIEEYGV